jgi:hypothetical protein
MAKVAIIIDAELSQEELDAYWNDPVDIVLNGFGKYYGSPDVRIHRIGGVIPDWSEFE